MSASSPLRSRREAGGTPKPQRWGVQSETGRLVDVLMGLPDHFSWRVVNAVAARTARLGLPFDLARAQAQHVGLTDALVAAGVRVHTLPADPVLPYQVFTRDSSVMTPWGALIMQPYRAFRRGETAACLRFYLESEIPIFDIVTAGTAEGGDLMILKPGLAVCGVSGERTTTEAVAQMRSWFEAEGWDFTSYAFDRHFLHLDVQLGMAAEGLALVCREAVEAELVGFLQARRIRVLDVPYAEAMRMGCNVVALGDERVLVAAQNPTIAEMCRAEGLEVIEIDVSMFAAAGGSLHCLCQPLRRED
ncbi:MAG TPA: arginine deiminase family protein [Caulobacteraceae bacterium]|nr:arginine deiminase family protein [Caulobacteraceae bacterium]